MSDGASQCTESAAHSDGKNGDRPTDARYAPVPFLPFLIYFLRLCNNVLQISFLEWLIPPT